MLRATPLESAVNSTWSPVRRALTASDPPALFAALIRLIAVAGVTLYVSTVLSTRTRISAVGESALTLRRVPVTGAATAAGPGDGGMGAVGGGAGGADAGGGAADGSVWEGGR